MLLAALVLVLHGLALRAALGGADRRVTQGTMAIVGRTIPAAPAEAALLEASPTDQAARPPATAQPLPRPRTPVPALAPLASAAVRVAATAPAVPAVPAGVAPPEQVQAPTLPASGPALTLETSLAHSPSAGDGTTGASPLPTEDGRGAAPGPPGAGAGAAPAAGILPAASSPHAYAVPAPVRLRYVVAAQAHGVELKGSAELLWRHDGRTYEARLQIVMPLLRPRIQQSTGAITADGLAPSRYSEKARNEEAVHFERDRDRLTFSNNQPAVTLAAGAQDRLSVMLQLGAIIGGSPSRYPPGSTLSIQTASTRDADLWQFTVEAEEELALPGGIQKALKLVRSPRKPFDQTVELWLAPGMDYAPVRARLTQQNGDRLDQQWAGTDRP